MIIPWQNLSEDALRGVIEDFVTREGTEYGDREVSLEEKIVQVQDQLVRGLVTVAYDAELDSVTIVPTNDLQLG